MEQNPIQLVCNNNSIILKSWNEPWALQGSGSDLLILQPSPPPCSTHCEPTLASCCSEPKPRPKTVLARLSAHWPNFWEVLVKVMLGVMVLLMITCEGEGGMRNLQHSRTLQFMKRSFLFKQQTGFKLEAAVVWELLPICIDWMTRTYIRSETQI